MARSYQAVDLIEDPGPLPKVRLRGREMPLLDALLTPVIVLLYYVRLYRRRRAVHKAIDRIAAQLQHELPGGLSNPTFKDNVSAKLRLWVRDHPPSWRAA